MYVSIRPVKPADYPAVNMLGTRSYEESYYESEESFASKMAGYPDGCFVADLDGIVGYVISFPYKLGQACPLNQLFELVPKPDCYYIHDLCVLEDFRGKGVATQLAERVLARKWEVTALVAVNGTGSFWRRFGFQAFAVVNYHGNKAEYMLKLAG